MELSLRVLKEAGRILHLKCIKFRDKDNLIYTITSNNLGMTETKLYQEFILRDILVNNKEISKKELEKIFVTIHSIEYYDDRDFDVFDAVKVFFLDGILTPSKMESIINAYNDLYTDVASSFSIVRDGKKITLTNEEMALFRKNDKVQYAKDVLANTLEADQYAIAIADKEKLERFADFLDDKLNSNTGEVEYAAVEEMYNL